MDRIRSYSHSAPARPRAGRLQSFLGVVAGLFGLAVLFSGRDGRAQPDFTFPAALNTNAASDSGIDINPQVTTDGLGAWVAVWWSTDSLGGTMIGTDPDILVARSTDNGATWSAPAPLNANAASDSGYDSAPQITTDGQGVWVAVWFSDDSLGGTIGTDPDILVATATILNATGLNWTFYE